MKKQTKIILPVGILVIGTLSMFGLLSMKSESPKRVATPRAKVVQAEVVKLGPVPAEIRAYGRVATAQPVQLYSEVAGTVHDGDARFETARSFKKGDLLVQIDDRQTLLRINSAKSDLMSALATVLPQIKVEYPDEHRVWQTYFDQFGFEGEMADLPETDNPKIKLFLSRFNVYKLYFSIRDLEITLAKHYFYAPFDGSIVSTALREGSTARSGSLLGEIINLEDLEVAVPLSPEDIRWLDRTVPVRFTSSELPGEWQGTIRRVGSSIDTRTQTVQAYMSVDTDGRRSLLDGVFLEAHIPGLVIENAISIPRKAVYQEKYVYVITDGKLEYREVSIARHDVDSVIVNGGLKDSDTLVLDALMGVAPGMPATPKLESEPERGA